ncbi:putative protein of unknown function (DUF 659) [Lyophyllum shimeji]|uniref:DUF659 domain-containing protein n=1 Tax=Lyophyllum shimeji TaxID=47721 RepID=A0A9P3UQH9_LYOSH|nr:putative protein of unknown function (DUF 659) [Lyophyllum shimeji]
MPAIRSASRGWWREYFYDHPKLASKDPIAFVGTGSSAKAKVYCKQCFNAHIAAAQLQDNTDVQLGRIVTAREWRDIETQLWSTRDDNRDAAQGWLRAATTTLLNHLRHCEHQSDVVRTRARDDPPAQSPRRRRRQASPPSPTPPLTLDYDEPDLSGLPVAGSSTGPGTLQHQNFFASTLYPPSTPRFASPVSSIAPSDSLSRASSMGSHTRSFSVGNLSSRKVLTRRIIPKLVQELQEEAKAAAKGKNATLEADGWTGENHHHLIAFMIAVEGKVSIKLLIGLVLMQPTQLHTVKIHDASTERKTTENLLRVLEEVVQNVEAEWGAKVIAIVTDASGESRKAWRLHQQDLNPLERLEP